MCFDTKPCKGGKNRLLASHRPPWKTADDEVTFAPSKDAKAASEMKRGEKHYRSKNDGIVYSKLLRFLMKIWSSWGWMPKWCLKGSTSRPHSFTLSLLSLKVKSFTSVLQWQNLPTLDWGHQTWAAWARREVKKSGTFSRYLRCHRLWELSRISFSSGKDEFKSLMSSLIFVAISIGYGVNWPLMNL